MERGFNFKEEDGQIVHFDDVGEDVLYTKIGKREAHVVDGGVVRDASGSVWYCSLSESLHVGVLLYLLLALIWSQERGRTNLSSALERPEYQGVDHERAFIRALWRHPVNAEASWR